MKRIAILTRDCAGVNTAIRSVVRTASLYDIEVFGTIKGYDGLIDDNFTILDHRSVSGIINKGGTILKTSRCNRFFDEKYQKQAVENIHKNNIEGLIVIGGNGSLTGAHILATKYNIPTISIPATIDNDINGVDICLGVDTAVNVALEALDKIRDTATSLERIFLVEVMGRNCGYIALQVALAGGCEEVIVPEMDVDLEKMCNEIINGAEKGKVSWIIVVAEGKAKAHDVGKLITEKTGFETRSAVLGHIQRGGRPTASDRIMASQLGKFSVDILKEGGNDQCVVLNKGELSTIPLELAIQPKSIDVMGFYNLIKILT